MRKTTTILAILIVASLFLLAGCQSKQSTEQTNTEKVTGNTVKGTETTQETSTASTTAEVKEFKVTAKQWSFDPAEIRVKQGDKVKLTITSVDVTHGFAIPDFKVNQRLEPGKTETVEFTADKKGTFSFFCNVQCGSGHGSMRGKLIVE